MFRKTQEPIITIISNVCIYFKFYFSFLFLILSSSDHFSYVQHNCSKGAFKDNQVPVCPICMKPVPSVKGQEDRAVSEHMDKFCNTQTKIYLNSCSFQNCKKRELVPFSCSQCKLNFCLKHRHFDIHNCNTQRRSQAA